MKIQIKNPWSNKVLFEADAESIGAAIKIALNARADLAGANLAGADLVGADLTHANLRCADLAGANLTHADLTGADLVGADLARANLTHADLTDAKNSELSIAKTRILPDGDLIGWKKCRNGVIVKLSIPAGAKRSSAFGRKCRAEFAEVLEIVGAKEAFSDHDPNFAYRVGKTVRPTEKFCEDFWQECAGGIQFFITRLEAENNA